MRPILLGSLLVMLFGWSCGGPSTLSWNGYGKVMFGRPLAEAEARVGEKALPEARDAACAFVSFPSYPGIEFMVEEGMVTRADAGPDVVNSFGIAVGMEFADLPPASSPPTPLPAANPSVSRAGCVSRFAFPCRVPFSAAVPRTAAGRPASHYDSRLRAYSLRTCS